MRTAQFLLRVVVAGSFLCAGTVSGKIGGGFADGARAEGNAMPATLPPGTEVTVRPDDGRSEWRGTVLRFYGGDYIVTPDGKKPDSGFDMSVLPEQVRAAGSI